MASSDLDRRVISRNPVARALRAVVSPYYRFRHAQLFHALRVALAMLVSILVTSGIHVPHGIWASVTVLIVIGGLQHHGNIRKKAADRAVGTLLGAAFGLFVLLQLRLIGSLPLTYLLMSAAAGVCGYYAVGKPGYIALLTAITMCIVAGHGDNSIDTGLWRTLNVLVGIVIALAFSFALPLHATYSWRYLLARNLRESARLYMQIVTGAPFDTTERLSTFATLGTRLVQLRALMPSVSQEIDVPVKRLEAIQVLHRSLLGALEMMFQARASQSAGVADGIGAADQSALQARAVRAMLLAMARALRFGSGERLRMPECVTPPSVGPVAMADELRGSEWLGQQFAGQVERLRVLLAEMEPDWNIERRTA